MRNVPPCNTFSFTSILRRNVPDAYACIKGNTAYPDLCGIVNFYKAPPGGVLVCAEVYGLPDTGTHNSSFYGMHIHEFGNCVPPFDKTGNHYNPGGSMHPYHAGDLPPLLGNSGYAWTVFFNARISIPDIIGKSVVIHSRRDDFTSQPAGDSGDKIGCGVIYPFS